MSKKFNEAADSGYIEHWVWTKLVPVAFAIWFANLAPVVYRMYTTPYVDQDLKTEYKEPNYNSKDSIPMDIIKLKQLFPYIW